MQMRLSVTREQDRDYRVAFVWLIAFICARVVLDYSILGISFNYFHVDPTSAFAIGGRNYVEHGLIAGIVPLVNNPPFVVQQDVYASWPPLNYLYVGYFAKLFGGSHRAVHGAMLTLSLVNAGLVFVLTNRIAGRLAGILAVVFFLFAPVNFSSAHISSHTPLAILFIMLTTWACANYFDAPLSRRYLAFATAFFALACLTSWESYCALAAWGILVALYRTRALVICFLTLAVTAAIA